MIQACIEELLFWQTFYALKRPRIQACTGELWSLQGEQIGFADSRNTVKAFTMLDCTWKI
jgi:hypothetical protein